jgi:formylglycine-generating enzyme required for sulfatase activity
LEISGFSMGRTEVTNAVFADLMNWAWDLGRIDTVALHTGIFWFPGDDPVRVLSFEHSDVYWDGSRFAIRPGRELYPVTGALWGGAATFCNWQSERDGLEPCYAFTPSATVLLYLVECDFTKNGYRLPTEAEWEKAARGGLSIPGVGNNPLPDRPFPWGTEDYLTPDLSGGQFSSQYANYDVLFIDLMPVGCFPRGRSPYGIADLFGNVAEWCNDWFDFDYYAVAPATDPPGPENEFPGVEDFHVLRGHSYWGPYIPGLGAFYLEHGLDRRTWADHRYASRAVGFRLVRGGP